MSRKKPAPEPEPPENDEEEDAEDAAPTAPQRAAPQRASDDEGRSFDERVTEYAKLVYPIAVLGGCLAVGAFVGPAPAVLVLAGGALVGVIALFWSSLRALVGETPLSGADAYAIGAPRAEEEQKQAVLRALKDLEFERSVGKISDEDYQELVAKYRAEAKRLLRILDEDALPKRRHVEALVARHLRRAGLDADAVARAAEAEGAEAEGAEAEGAEAEGAEAADEAPAKDTEEQASSEGAEPAEASRTACAKCGTVNDVDAVFCKKCGARQHEEATAPEEAP